MDTLKILGAVLIVITQGYILYYLSYFKKKGDNLATKEDIEEITNLTETIKSRLSISSQHGISINSHRIEACIKFIEVLNDVTYFIPTRVITVSNGGEFATAFFKEIMPKFDHARSRFFLFIENENLLHLTIKFQKVVIDQVNFVIENNADLSKLNNNSTYSTYQDTIGLLQIEITNSCRQLLFQLLDEIKK